MLIQIQFGLQYADFYLAHGIPFAIPFFPRSICSYIVILCADSAATLEVAAFSATIEVFAHCISCELSSKQ